VSWAELDDGDLGEPLVLAKRGASISEVLEPQVRARVAAHRSAHYTRAMLTASPALQTVLLLLASNVFMTLAWYGHLATLRTAPLVVAVLVSWTIALAEYALQVPANRIGYGVFTLAQLKIIQEIITMTVFAAYAVGWAGEALRWNYAAAAVCLVAAAIFIFRY
jgi:uncharacterized protein (DUF486 family)